MLNLNLKTLIVFCTVSLALILAIPIETQASTIVGTSTKGTVISSPTIWTKALSPYLIQGIVTFDASSPLVVEKGVEIRFANPSSYIGVYGSLSFAGTPDERVRIYGISDKCGYESWFDIRRGATSAGTSSVQLDYFDMSNGARLMVNGRPVYIRGAHVECAPRGMWLENVLDSSIDDSIFDIVDDTALTLSGSRARISNSSFDGGRGIGVSGVKSEFTIDNSRIDNFGVGINIAASYATVTSSLIKENGSGIEISTMIFMVSATNTLPENTPLSEKFTSNVYLANNTFKNNVYNTISSTPGNILVKKDNLIDSDPNPPKTKDPVIVIPGILGSAIKNGKWTIDPIFHIYDNLIDTLAKNGYERDKNLFTFPYDWHQSNDVTARNLKDFIFSVRSKCQCSKVDVVAHSMGGLVTRRYIESSDYSDDVDQVVFLGTPHLGAPSAYLSFAHNSFGDGVADKLLAFIFSREAKAAKYSSISEYIQKAPISSARELLPINQYLFDTVGNPIPFSSSHYYLNDFLSRLYADIKYLFQRVDILDISGEIDDPRTTSGFRVSYTKGSTTSPYGFPTKTLLDLGDTTVPWDSARGGYGISSFATSSLVLSYSHNSLPTEASSFIVRTLTGKNATSIVKKSTHPAFNMLIVQTFLPSKIKIISPDGIALGYEGDDLPGGIKATTTAGVDDDTFYFEDENGSLITIPEPKVGDYQIFVKPKKEKDIPKLTIDVAVSDDTKVTTKRIVIKDLVTKKTATSHVKIIKATTTQERIIESASTSTAPYLPLEEIEDPDPIELPKLVEKTLENISLSMGSGMEYKSSRPKSGTRRRDITDILTPEAKIGLLESKLNILRNNQNKP